ncbi:MAG TPA: NAD-dependent dehydratase [Calditrichia bacterium]|nr:NAD-dependent dehydratase [Calditrichota bacterium]HQU73960.1 NAD-dependent dehydratase [Calditrichia bacterium]HQV32297.1 NAD-dependent dehydratase [Calditrichia bacterium]
MTPELHVIFGTGPVGMAVMAELLRKKKAVLMINRSGRIPLPNGVDYMQMDVAYSDNAVRACKNAAVIYNCTNPPYHLWDREFPPLHSAILKAAERTGARLVIMENLYEYGPTYGLPLSEENKPAPCSQKGRIRQEMTREWMSAFQEGRVQATAGRASDFFGPGVLYSALGMHVLKPLVAGNTTRVFGNPDLLHTYTYVPDIGRALVILGERSEALGRFWHIPSPETTTTREVLKLFFEAAGHKPKIKGISRLGVNAIGLFNPAVKESKEMLYQFEQPFVMNHERFEKVFGMAPTPLRKAVRETVAWFKG